MRQHRGQLDATWEGEKSPSFSSSKTFEKGTQKVQLALQQVRSMLTYTCATQHNTQHTKESKMSAFTAQITTIKNGVVTDVSEVPFRMEQHAIDFVYPFYKRSHNEYRTYKVRVIRNADGVVVFA